MPLFLCFHYHFHSIWTFAEHVSSLVSPAVLKPFLRIISPTKHLWASRCKLWHLRTSASSEYLYHRVTDLHPPLRHLKLSHRKENSWFLRNLPSGKRYKLHEKQQALVLTCCGRLLDYSFQITISIHLSEFILNFHFSRKSNDMNLQIFNI